MLFKATIDSWNLMVVRCSYSLPETLPLTSRIFMSSLVLFYVSIQMHWYLFVNIWTASHLLSHSVLLISVHYCEPLIYTESTHSTSFCRIYSIVNLFISSCWFWYNSYLKIPRQNRFVLLNPNYSGNSRAIAYSKHVISPLLLQSIMHLMTVKAHFIDDVVYFYYFFTCYYFWKN